MIESVGKGLSVITAQGRESNAEDTGFCFLRTATLQAVVTGTLTNINQNYSYTYYSLILKNPKR